MKRFFGAFCVLLILAFSPLSAVKEDPLENIGKGFEEIYGQGAEESSHQALCSSMLGWGICLAVAIIIVAAVVHQSTGSSD